MILSSVLMVYSKGCKEGKFYRLESQRGAEQIDLSQLLSRVRH